MRRTFGATKCTKLHGFVRPCVQCDALRHVANPTPYHDESAKFAAQRARDPMAASIMLVSIGTIRNSPFVCSTGVDSLLGLFVRNQLLWEMGGTDLLTGVRWQTKHPAPSSFRF